MKLNIKIAIIHFSISLFIMTLEAYPQAGQLDT